MNYRTHKSFLQHIVSGYISRSLMAVAVITAVLGLTGCANPEIVQLSPDTYMLSRNVGGRITGGLAGTKAEVIKQANEFAAAKNKVAIPLSARETPESFSSLGTYEYQFRVVDKNDPEFRRTSLVPRPEVVIEKSEKVTSEVRTKDEKAPDLFTELTKLDDLRKKGIITEEEFTTQKKKLLAR